MHLGWVLSHFLRSAWQDHRQLELGHRLAEEVAVLQAEVHRAHRLIAGYSELVERCEGHQDLRAKGNFWFFLILLILTLLLAFSWLTKSRKDRPQILDQTDTGGGSSDSDTPPTSVIKFRKTGSVGPTRPSHFVGKGKK